jgi:hypothetical protein
MPFPHSKTEGHHHVLAAAIPESQRLDYLAEFILDYLMAHGSAGLIMRFPVLAKTWESVDPTLRTIAHLAASKPYHAPPHRRVGEVTLGGNPLDLEKPNVVGPR